RVLFADLRTDRLIDTLPVRDIEWDDYIGKTGSLRGTIAVPDDGIARRCMRLLTARTAVWMEQGGQIVWGGILWTRTPQNRRTRPRHHGDPGRRVGVVPHAPSAVRRPDRDRHRPARHRPPVDRLRAGFGRRRHRHRDGPDADVRRAAGPHVLPIRPLPHRRTTRPTRRRRGRFRMEDPVLAGHRRHPPQESAARVPDHHGRVRGRDPRLPGPDPVDLLARGRHQPGQRPAVPRLVDQQQPGRRLGTASPRRY
ncbi:hypothetical protein ACU686_05105, partial [Yinghuangia aomiensis]